MVQPSSIHRQMLPTFRFYNENLQKFVLGQQPLNDKTWADYLAGLDKLGAKDLEASAKKTLQQAGFLK